MPNKKYFTKDAIQEICDLKIATFNTYISDFTFELEEVIINSKRQKEYESLAIIRLLESKGRITESEKFYDYLNDSYESLLISKIEEPRLTLPEPINLSQQLLDSNRELITIVLKNSEVNIKSHLTIQYLLKKQEELSNNYQKLFIQNELLLEQISKLLRLEEKRQEKLESIEAKKTDLTESSRQGFTIFGFTICRSKPTRSQTA